MPIIHLNQKVSFFAWLTVALLCVVGCLNYLDRIMITTMRSSIIESIPMSDAKFGLLTSVFLWTYGIFSPFAGFLADRYSRSKVIILSLFVWSLVTWLTSQVNSFEGLVVTRALMGISEACYIPAALSLIADYHKGNTRSFATGIHMAGIMAGQSLGFLGGMIAEKGHWHDAFHLFGGIGLAYSIVLLFLLRDVKTEEPAPTGEVVELKFNFIAAIKGLFSKRAYLLLVIFWGLNGIVGWMIMAWLPTYYKEHFQLSQTQAGLFATGYLYPLSMFGVLFGGYVADRWARKNNKSRILVPMIGFCIAAPAVFLASNTAILYIAVGGFMIYAFTRVFSDANLMPILCMIADKRYRATGYGILNFFSCIVGGVGIYVSGVWRDQDMDSNLLFVVAVIAMLLCALVLYLIKKDKQVSIAD